jgi:hypothetical protein
VGVSGTHYKHSPFLALWNQAARRRLWFSVGRRRREEDDSDQWRTPARLDGRRRPKHLELDTTLAISLYTVMFRNGTLCGSKPRRIRWWRCGWPTSRHLILCNRRHSTNLGFGQNCRSTPIQTTLSCESPLFRILCFPMQRKLQLCFTFSFFFSPFGDVYKSG